MKRSCVPLPALVLVTACSPAASPPPRPLVVEPVAPPVEKPAEQRFIVWTRGEQDRTTSHWIRSTATGHEVIDKKEGVFVAADNGTWSVRPERVDVETHPCDPNEGPSDAPPGEGVAYRLIVELVGGQEAHVVVEPETEPGVNEVIQTVSVLASVGPYLFIKEHTYTYACGAHGGSSARLITWDLRRRASTELAGERVSNQMVTEARTAMLEPGEPPEESPELTFIGVIPRYESADLVCGYLFTTFACYACGGGEWGSYTKHAIVTGPVPDSLERHTQTPDVVRAFVGEKGAEVGGWSTAGMALGS